MSVISDIKMILESNDIHLLHDVHSYLEQIERWDAIKDADLVDVVRCKDCFKKESCRTTNVWAVPPSDEWFCADGERREDDKGRSE